MKNHPQRIFNFFSGFDWTFSNYFLLLLILANQGDWTFCTPPLLSQKEIIEQNRTNKLIACFPPIVAFQMHADSILKIIPSSTPFRTPFFQAGFPAITLITCQNKNNPSPVYGDTYFLVSLLRVFLSCFLSANPILDTLYVTCFSLQANNLVFRAMSIRVFWCKFISWETPLKSSFFCRSLPLYK